MESVEGEVWCIGDCCWCVLGVLSDVGVGLSGGLVESGVDILAGGC